jgi:hypothetical protein
MANPVYNPSDYTSDQTLARIAQAESGGQNVPNSWGGSSAHGLWQVLNPTFEGIKKQNPQKYGDMTWDQFKADPRNQAMVAEDLANSHRTYMKNNGIQDNAANMYAMWVLGAGGGSKLLRADPNAPITDVMSPQQLAANPMFAKHQNAQGLRNWFAQRVGEPVPQMTAQAPQAAPQPVQNPMAMNSAPQQMNPFALAMAVSGNKNNPFFKV